MTEKKIKVFVSYNSRDKGLADTVVKNLQKLSISVWYDAFEIFVGHDITDKVYEGLMSCDYIAVILTKNSVSSPWVKEEINYAKYRSITENGKRTILPLLFEECEIPPTIATLRYADFTKNISKGFNDLADSLGITLLDTRENPIPTGFREKISDLIQSIEPGDEIGLSEADSLGHNNVNEMKQGIFYTLKYDFQMGDNPHSLTEKHLGDYWDTLICDHGKLTTWIAFNYALAKFKNSNGPLPFKRDSAIDVFQETLLDSLYINEKGLQREGVLFTNIANAASTLSSLSDS